MVEKTSKDLDFYFKGPISAMCFKASHLLVGEGPILSVYDLKSKQ